MSQRPTSRRHLSPFLALLAVLALVAGACGGDSEDGGGGTDDGGDTDVAAEFECPVGAHTEADGSTEVTVWHAYNALTQETLESLAEEYNASQDAVTVKVEAQGTYEELLKKYEDALGDRATLPDIVFAEDTNARFLVDSGTVMPVESCIDADPDAAEFYDAVVPSVRTAYTVEGALWPAAFGVSMPVMYVNDDHLRAAGVDTETYPATLDELRTAAEKLKATNRPGMDAPIVMSTQGWFVENWLTGAGQPIVNNGNGRDGLAAESEFDSEATNQIFEWMHSMAADGLLKILPDGGIDQFLALAQQTSSILIDGSRAITPVVAVIDSARAQIAGVDTEALGDTDLQGLDVNVAPIAGLEAAGQGGAAGSAGWLVASEDDAAIAGSWDFLRFFTSTDSQVRWALEGSYLPVTPAVSEDPRIVEQFTTTRGGRWLATTYEQMQDLNADFPMPVMGPYKEFRVGVKAIMESMSQSSADPAAAVDEFDASFQADLEAYADEVG